jgi:hypothetical protein
VLSRIDELAYNLENMSHDDKCMVEDFNDKQKINESG